MKSHPAYQHAMTLMANKQYLSANTVFHELLLSEPENATYCEGLAECYFLQQQYADAVKYFERAALLAPDNPNPHFQIGNIFVRLGRLEEGCQNYVNALRIMPNAVQVYESLAKALIKMQAYEQASQAYQRALKLSPQRPAIRLGMATALMAEGKHDEAMVQYSLALALNPNPIEHTSFIFNLNYLPDVPATMIANCHLDWGRLHTARMSRQAHALTKRHKKLRIGLVSSDFYRHPVAYYLEPFLEHYDREHIELYCYAHVVKQDEVTSRLQSYVTAWRSIDTRDIAAAVEAIRADEIDILVDLSGQTACKLLLIFGHKPAPVQVSWLGYFNTTGLDTMDYFITDLHSSPAGQQQYFTEQLRMLPHNRFCYRPPEYAPEVSTLPAIDNGYVTFGCFNNYAKINASVIALWADVLKACPGSKLMLKNKAMNDAYMQQQILANFEKHGIAAERLILRPTSPHPELLATYAEVDIALDPFPFTGGLTTSEALWMGVPLVTMAGETLVSRQGAAFLTVLNKTEWIAACKEDYVSIACKLAGNLQALAGDRLSLRAQMQASPLCDGKQFARDLQALFSGMLE